MFVVLAPLVGCGSADAPTEPTKTIAISATEYEFGGDAAAQILAGETVLLRLTNEGQLEHEMQVLDTDGRLIDRTDQIAPGDQADVVVTFESAGVYQLICDVDDHLSRGQRASFVVDASS